ncbi:hypothetical protein BCR36DRAFT_375794 [Piromyces finnis]|uniref:Uncharacterized protein n=1 Tax=Piromyces finnis TaxID=1754191 RepID=A0A1Y1UCX0_9FUNG|nr:hypothetical protein BCR36DRAFT_375794 [Piromyces finnis]|eukprot:ORX35839.1 hypothetical protein BCR36DRAFT_375794 [Piromyces finnis]
MYEDQGCKSTPSHATDKKNEIFLNSSDLSSSTNAKLTKDLIKCIFDKGVITCSAKDGAPDEVYVNSHNNTEIIYCTTEDGCKRCATEKVILGYYVNAGDTTKPVIKCEKEGTECVEEESKECPSSSDIIPGNYCYSEGSLKFYPSSNSTAISASKSDDIYTFATIPANGFPGIKSETGALFKILVTTSIVSTKVALL